MLLSPQELTLIFLALAVLLGAARLLGEVARWLHQPSVLGEIAAGVLLGPTIFGRIAPELQTALFPAEGTVAIVLEALFALAVVLFLLVAGLEVDLSVAFRQGKTAFSVATMGMLVPFVMGFAVAWYAPKLLMDVPPGRELVFALFFATALCISALPVIVKILKDLDLMKSDLGVVVVASAIVNDLIGWIIFAVVLGMMGADKVSLSLEMIILLTLLFVVFMLTAARWIVDRLLPILQAHMSWPAGVLGATLSLALLCAALTEWIGIHAIFGAFLFGVALGDSRHLRQRTRATLDHFISFTFAPLFFASIGLKVDFISSFALGPVLIVFVLACVGKILGCWIGGRLGGLTSKESLAVGAAKNARGAMEIILGLLALQYGLIDDKLFVALVIMALLTSMVSGTMVQRILKTRKAAGLEHYLNTSRIVWNMKARSREEAIRELSEAAAKTYPKLETDDIFDQVWKRELMMPTGMENQVAVPHARMHNAEKTLVLLGRLKRGVDFDAIDGEPVRLVFLLITPAGNDQDQLDVLKAIARVTRKPGMTSKMLEAETPTELLALLNSEPEEEH